MKNFFANRNRLVHEVLYESDIINKKLNKDDLKDHNAVGVVIMKNNKVLMLDHIKFNMLTIPVGKGDGDESPEDAMIRETEEEIGIKLKKLKQIVYFKNDEVRNGITVHMNSYVYLCENFSGVPYNKEPNKHRDLFWMDFNDFLQLDTISFMTNAAIEYFKNKM